MSKIYLGPWQFGKCPPQYSRGTRYIDCYFRPILNPCVNNLYFEAPQIAFDDTRNVYYAPYHDAFGSVDYLKSWYDNLLMEKGYGTKFRVVEFLTQEQFDKFRVLI